MGSGKERVMNATIEVYENLFVTMLPKITYENDFAFLLPISLPAPVIIPTGEPQSNHSLH